MNGQIGNSVNQIDSESQHSLYIICMCTEVSYRGLTVHTICHSTAVYEKKMKEGIITRHTSVESN